MSDFLWLHAWGTACPVDAWCSAMDEVAESAGLRLLSHDEAEVEREYGRAETREFSLRLEPEEESCQVWGSIGSADVDSIGLETVARLFRGVVSAFPPILARSFNESIDGSIIPSELDGELEFIDWFQYFSPSVVARLGAGRLAGVSVGRLEWLPSGGCAFWLPGSPIAEVSGRRAAAEALGVTLRPLIGRNPLTGKAITIPWS